MSNIAKVQTIKVFPLIAGRLNPKKSNDLFWALPVEAKRAADADRNPIASIPNKSKSARRDRLVKNAKNFIRSGLVRNPKAS
jgi:hypothetical protein